MGVRSKKHRLTDGTFVTVNELAQATGLSLSASRNRLRLTKIRCELFAGRFTRQDLEQRRTKVEKTEANKKVFIQTKTQVAYEKHLIDTRSAYDPLWKLAMQGIGAGKTVGKGI